MGVDWGLILGASVFLFGVLAALLKNYATITATTARSVATEARIQSLEAALHEHQLITVSTYVTNATLKEAMSAFGASVDRLTDRLDRLFNERPGNTP